MPAQKRRLPSPSSQPRDHVEANGTADASSAGGGGGGLQVGGAANRVADSQPPRVAGEPARIETPLSVSRISQSPCAVHVSV